jgi:myo-inositol-1(or 4)-monophosphatase
LFLLGGQINADLMPLLTRLAGQCDGMRRLGATALDFAYLAAGRVDAVVSGPVLFWDVAAGQLLLREAGGLLSDVNDATAFAFNQETASFVAATPRVFAKFFSEVKKSCRAAEAQRAAKP